VSAKGSECAIFQRLIAAALIYINGAHKHTAQKVRKSSRAWCERNVQLIMWKQLTLMPQCHSLVSFFIYAKPLTVISAFNFQIS